MPTHPTQIRLTDDDRAKVEALREHFGLPSASSAIRYSIETMFRRLNEPLPKPTAKAVRKKGGR